MSSFRCEVCNQGPQDGVAVYRQNAKGQPGIWRCAQHAVVLIDPVVKLIGDAIEQEAGRDK